MDSWIGHIGSLFLSSINQRKKKKTTEKQKTLLVQYLHGAQKINHSAFFLEFPVSYNIYIYII